MDLHRVVQLNYTVLVPVSPFCGSMDSRWFKLTIIDILFHWVFPLYTIRTRRLAWIIVIYYSLLSLVYVRWLGIIQPWRLAYLVCNWLIKGSHVLILNMYLTPADNNPNPPSLAHFPSWSISPAHFASITLIDYSFLFFSLLQLRCLRFIRFLFNTNLRSVSITSIYCMQF